eukprot:6187732-Pleurochrysis_carterae.AAC.1
MGASGPLTEAHIILAKGVITIPYHTCYSEWGRIGADTSPVVDVLGYTLSLPVTSLGMHIPNIVTN